MWELDYKESWVPKNWCFWTVVLEKTLESLLDCKEIQPVILKEISPELEGLMLKLKLQYFGHLMWTTDPDSGKDGRQEEKGMTEDDMVGWHHWRIDMSLSRPWKLVIDREAWHAAIHGVAKSVTWLSNWTELTETKWIKFSAIFHIFPLYKPSGKPL